MSRAYALSFCFSLFPQKLYKQGHLAYISNIFDGTGDFPSAIWWHDSSTQHPARPDMYSRYHCDFIMPSRGLSSITTSVGYYQIKEHQIFTYFVGRVAPVLSRF